MTGKLLGHTQVQTTARYAHLARDSIQTAAARILETIRDVCAQPAADDGLRFDTANILAEPFGEDRTHGAFRVRTSAQLGAAIIPVQIDVGFGDAVPPGPLDLEYPVLLDLWASGEPRPRPTATGRLWI